MLEKYQSYWNWAKKGISSRIFNASRKGVVSRFLYGEDVELWSKTNELYIVDLIRIQNEYVGKED